MDLSTLLRDHRSLRLYEEAVDQPTVLEMLAQSPMQLGGIDLIYDRSPDFQALLRRQARRFMTICGKDRGKIRFVYSFSMTKKWIHGALESCAYIGDFRTDGSRRSTVAWRRDYPDFIKALRDDPAFSNPRYILTAILKKNQVAIRNLAEAKTDYGVRYDYLSELDMVNVFWRWPWASRPTIWTPDGTLGKTSDRTPDHTPPQTRIQTVTARADDADELRGFLSQRERRKLFGANFRSRSVPVDGVADEGHGDDEWEHRSKTWPGFAAENFLVQRDALGKIIACALPWDPSSAKRITITRTCRALEFLLRGLAFFGVSVPRVGESLKILYLTHLECANGNQDASLRSFLDAALKRRGFQMVSYAAAPSWPKIRGYVTQHTPVMLFSVGLSGDAPLSAGQSSAANPEVGFEMSLV